MSEPTIQQQVQEAMRMQGAGRVAEAEKLWRQVLERDPNHTLALRVLGSIFGQTNRHHEAVELLGRCILIDPNDAGAHSMLGGALTNLKRYDKAMEHLTRAVELQPDKVYLQFNLGKSLRDQKRNEEAEAAFRRATELQPDFAPAWNNLANTLRDLGKYQEAYETYRRALQLRPSDAKTLHNFGLCCRDLLKLDEASRAFDTSLAYEPGYHECRLSRAMLLLLRGQFTIGWNEYEARFDTPRPILRSDYGKPVWDGQDPEGRTILLYSEQGLGDAIQFARYAPLLAEQGASVIVECRPELTRLFQSLRGMEQVITPDDELPEFDVYRGMMSMPLIFRTALDSIPADVPYLRADRTQVKRWKRIIEPGQLRVGLAWAGAAGFGNDRNRSMPLEQLAPLARVAEETSSDAGGMRFYSLQKGDAAKQALAPLDGMKIIDLSAELEDFADTAAAIENLDLVISVDTAVAHLAGALNKPVWTLLPFSPDWRWMLDRDDSPWYPSMRLFRQTSIGDWPDVIRRVAEALGTFSPS